MAFIDDLAKATAVFNQGAQQLATTQAFSRANEQLAAINEQALNEQEKRAATQQLANELAQNLSAVGAPVSQIQQAFQTFGPAPLKTGLERVREAQAFGTPEEQARAQQALIAEDAPAFEQQRRAQTFKRTESAKDRALKVFLSSAKTGGPIFGDATAKAIQTTVPKNLRKDAFKEVGVLEELQASGGKIDEIINSVKDIGPLGRAPLPFEEAKTELETANANLVSVAMTAIKGNPSEKEAERQIEPFLISATDTPEQVEAKRQGLQDFLILQRKPTPILNRFNIAETVIPITGKRPADVTLDDFKKLPKAEREKFLQTLPPEDQKRIKRDAMKALGGRK